MNRYDIKVYSKSWVYQTTINPNVVMNDISFTSNVNWWLWELDLQLALPFSDNTFHWWEIIKVDLFNERYKQWKQIYYWYVSQVSRIFDINKWYIQLSILWIASLLNSILYSWTKTWSVSSILTDIINSFNWKYSWNLITIWWIDTYSEDIEIELNDWTTCKSAIDKINDICNYYWFIDSEWKFWFKSKWNQKRHILANEQNIESMNITSSIEKVYNRVYVSRKDWEIKQYQNTTSQWLYWIKEKYENEPSIANESTQDEYGNNYILENSNPKNASSIVVNSSYDIESIVPWDIISVVNIDFDITDLLIEKIKYGYDKVVLTLDENESLWGVIK